MSLLFKFYPFIIDIENLKIKTPITNDKKKLDV